MSRQEVLDIAGMADGTLAPFVIGGLPPLPPEPKGFSKVPCGKEPYKQALKVKVACPLCRRTLTMHALAYRHTCRKYRTYDSKKQITMDGLQRKIVEKFGAEADRAVDR